MDEQKQKPDFGEYGAFLEDSLRHILKYKPEAIAFTGIMPDRSSIGAFYESSINDKILMAGSILVDVIVDTIKANAGEIREILENAPGESSAD